MNSLPAVSVISYLCELNVARRSSHSCVWSAPPNHRKSSLCAMRRIGRLSTHLKKNFRSQGVFLYPHSATQRSNSLRSFDRQLVHRRCCLQPRNLVPLRGLNVPLEIRTCSSHEVSSDNVAISFYKLICGSDLGRDLSRTG
jgi:hypothetical protein